MGDSESDEVEDFDPATQSMYNSIVFDNSLEGKWPIPKNKPMFESVVRQIESELSNPGLDKKRIATLNAKLKLFQTKLDGIFAKEQLAVDAAAKAKEGSTAAREPSSSGGGGAEAAGVAARHAGARGGGQAAGPGRAAAAVRNRDRAEHAQGTHGPR